MLVVVVVVVLVVVDCGCGCGGCGGCGGGGGGSRKRAANSASWEDGRIANRCAEPGGKESSQPAILPLAHPPATRTHAHLPLFAAAALSSCAFSDSNFSEQNSSRPPRSTMRSTYTGSLGARRQERGDSSSHNVDEIFDDVWSFHPFLGPPEQFVMHDGVAWGCSGLQVLALRPACRSHHHTARSMQPASHAPPSS